MIRHGSKIGRVSRIVAVVLGGVGLAGGATVVISGATAGAAPHEAIYPVTSSQNGSTTAAGPSSVYPTNAAGESYGSAASAASAQEEPDLIKAIGVSTTGSSVTGYVRKAELKQNTGGNVHTPEEATAWTRSHTGGASTSIPLYAEDGTTVIGKFEITPPSSSPPAPGQP